MGCWVVGLAHPMLQPVESHLWATLSVSRGRTKPALAEIRLVHFIREKLLSEARVPREGEGRVISPRMPGTQVLCLALEMRSF